MQGGQMSIGLEIPMWIPYLCLPIAFVLMSIRAVEIIVRCWRDQPLHVGEISVEDIR
jgi:C4-dicarboxylate transporter DctQ subunit